MRGSCRRPFDVGRVGLDEVVAAVGAAERRLEELRDAADLPPQPDRAWVDDWLHRVHLAYWGTT